MYICMLLSCCSSSGVHKARLIIQCFNVGMLHGVVCYFELAIYKCYYAKV